ncbi:MASE1 domain-containing protein [bacterium]|nr:MASE1 domain-containing protein [bacterium]
MKRPYLVNVSLVAFAYYITASIGLRMDAISHMAALVWPPTGIALAAVICLGYRIWPGIFLAAFLVNWNVTGQPWLAGGIALGNVLEALVGGYLLLNFASFDRRLERMKDVLSLIFFGAIFSTLISATVGVGLTWWQHPYLLEGARETWKAWWIGDILGNLIVGPLLLIPWARSAWNTHRARAIEFFFFCITTLLLSLISFHGSQAWDLGISNHTLVYLLFPLIVWSAIRYGPGGNAVTTFILAAIAVSETAAGHGPFSLGPLRDRLVHLHGFLTIISVTGLTLAAALAERRQAVEAKKRSDEELQRSHAQLERMVRERTAELQQSEERFRLMVENVKDYAIMMLDPQGRIATWNEGAQHLTGFEPHEVLGKHFSIFYLSEDVEAQKPEMQLAQSQIEGRFQDESWRVKKDGSRFWCHIALTAVRGRSGELLGFSVVTRDLTEQRLVQAELLRSYDDLERRVKVRTEELDHSRNQLNIILSGITDGIVVTDDRGQIVYANETGTAMCGFADLQTFLKTPPYTEVADGIGIFDENSNPFPLELLPSRLVFSGLENPPETVLCFKSLSTGEERWLMVKSAPIVDETNKVRLAVSIMKEFTERRKSAESIKFIDEVSSVLFSSLDYEATLRQIAELAVPRLSDWCMIDLIEGERKVRRIAVIHPDPEKVKLADEWRTRYPPNWDMPTGNIHAIRTGKSELYSVVTDELLRTSTQDSDQYEMARSLGIRSAMVVPLVARGRTLGAVTFIAAESLRRYTQVDLAMAEELGRRAGIAVDNALLYKQAQEAIRARDEFLSIASHELKTPITSLSLQIQMTKNNIKVEERIAPPPEKLAKVFDISEKQINRLTGLVEELLDASKIQAGKFSFNFENTDLSETVQDMINRFTDHLAKVKCQIECKIESGISGYLDRARIEQVVDNLMSNVIKYAPSQPVRIELSRQAAIAQLVIEDGGPGIPVDRQEKVFERFVRGNSMSNVSGLGLGLFIVKEIIKGHHGSVQLENGKTGGARFVIKLPLFYHGQKVLTGRETPDEVYST